MPDCTILTDTTAGRDDDLLAFRRYLDPLEQILRSPKVGTPLTVGIFGTWGSGKSTLLRMLAERLQGDDFLCVDFNPWLYRKEPSMLVPLLHTLHDAMDAADGGRNFKESARKIFDVLARLGAETFLKTVTAGASSVERLEKLEETYAKTAGKLTSELRNLRGLLQKEADAIAAAKTRIVVFIDDLDRCEPDQIIDVLESTKLFLDLRNVVIVLAIDKEVIDRGIQVKYGKFGFAEGRDYAIGAEYLEKMIQLPLQLYPLQAAQVGDLIRKLAPPGVGLLAHNADFLQKVLLPNPRKIKRIVNILTLTDAIRGSTPALAALPEAPLVHLVVLQVQYPELYNNAVRQQELLVVMEEVYAGQRNPETEANFIDLGARGETLRKLCQRFHEPVGILPLLFGAGVFGKAKPHLAAYLSMLGG